MTKVLLVDDQTIVLLGIAKLLELSGDIDVLAMLSSGEACIDYLSKNPLPDVILLDIHMPEMNISVSKRKNWVPKAY